MVHRLRWQGPEGTDASSQDCTRGSLDRDAADGDRTRARARRRSFDARHFARDNFHNESWSVDDLPRALDNEDTRTLDDLARAVDDENARIIEVDGELHEDDTWSVCHTAWQGDQDDHDDRRGDDFRDSGQDVW